MTKKKIKDFKFEFPNIELDYNKTILFAVCLLILVFTFMIGFNFGKEFKNINNAKAVVCTDINNLTTTVDIINKNCGSVFITKQWGNDNWYVYNAGNYKTLNECITGVKQ
jgi:hypothetical protein